MNWIKTSERLPNCGDYGVLVTYGAEGFVVSFYSASKDYWGKLESPPEYWLEIPPLPEEQGETMRPYGADVTDEITKLIELAKEQGAAEERERACKILRDAGMYGGEIYEAIRNRERK